MSPTEADITQVLDALGDPEAWNQAWSIVYGWVGDDWLPARHALCLALVDRMRPDLGTYDDDRTHGLNNREGQMFDQIVAGLAHSEGAETAEVVIDLCHHLAQRGVGLALRKIVQELTYERPAPELLDIFHRENPGEPRESWTVLLHQCIARGDELSTDADVIRYLAQVKEAGHPLGILPVRLTGEERAARALPPSREFKELARQHYDSPPPRQTDVGGPFADAVVTNRIREHAALLAPYRLWLDRGMNARVDVATVWFDQPVRIADVDAAALHRLSVACMSGPVPPVLQRTSLIHALAHLNADAVHGGTYPHGLGGAYGRLATWQCVAALSGFDMFDFSSKRPNVIPEVRRAADTCAWWRFHGTRWFTDPHFEKDGYALAVLRPNGRSMALIAASD